MTKNPFFIVPWQEDFLNACRALASDLTGGRPEKAVLVFPHSRPRRYLTDLYRSQAAKPVILPGMMTAEQLRDRFRIAWAAADRPLPRRADRLDQVALLRASVARVAACLPDSSPLHGLEGKGGMARFYPWGVRLVDVLEECLSQMVEAADLDYAEDEVVPFAAALLGELKAIREDWIDSLDKAGLTTPGLDAFTVGRLASDPDQRLPGFLRDKTVILAGFVCPTRAESALFRYLWEQGAAVCLHTDPGVVNGGGHWSCADHVSWLHEWGAEAKLLVPEGSVPRSKPRFHFFAGHDLHSQLRQMRQELEEDRRQGQRAVVLPHASLLMPVLHHLPHKDINISLGYPLDRTLLGRLVENVLKVRESLRPGGRHHWRTLLDLFRHPYVRMLRVFPPEEEDPEMRTEEGIPLRPLIRRLEQRLREGSRLPELGVLLEDLLDDTLGDLDAALPREREEENGLCEEAARLLEQTVHILVTAWTEADTLAAVAGCLEELCRLLLDCGRSIWPLFPLDAECLTRLMGTVIPALARSSMSHEFLPPEALFTIVRQALTDERVPFEADPLTGLQVLGMLETRLLRFDRVWLLDLTEDRLPGSPHHDPLLPDSLRGLLGLPDTGHRDTLMAHTFYRLLAGAEEVRLFWQEGVESNGLLDNKKIRSRFVEKALWDCEKAQGKRLEPGEAPLKTAAFPFRPSPNREPAAIPKSPAIHARLNALLHRPLSPTFLDSYLRCPVRFFHDHVCHIRPLPLMAEGDDHAAVGRLLHKVLCQAFTPLLGLELTEARREELKRSLPELFRAVLAQDTHLCDRLPGESLIMFRTAGPLRLRRFMEKQPVGIRVLEVEREKRAVLEVGQQRRELSGFMDRLDEREGQIVILDYKSGNSLPKAPSLSFWNEDELWDSLSVWEPEELQIGQPVSVRDPLNAVADALSSLQLPCYLYLQAHAHDVSAGSGLPPGDAGWIHLADDGKESLLFGPKWSEEDRMRVITERIPQLLRFVLDHMERSSCFRPRPGRHCDWCPWAVLCVG